MASKYRFNLYTDIKYKLTANTASKYRLIANKFNLATANLATAEMVYPVMVK